ncbi:hypothetical protein [Streptomyces sp. NPDC058726]|uniref:hypothetical protein n=1 Tax=Streptomyces sp. NPDC058726 TaxID=3346611 RepID=UPI00367F7570
MLQPNKLDRTPVPFVKMRYDNTRTGSASKGDARGFAPLATLVRGLGLIEGASGSSSGRTGTVASGARTAPGDGILLTHGGTREPVDTERLQCVGLSSVQE